MYDLDQTNITEDQRQLFDNYYPAKDRCSAIIKVPKPGISLGEKDIDKLMNDSIEDGIAIFRINCDDEDVLGKFTHLKLKTGTPIHVVRGSRPESRIRKEYTTPDGTDYQLELVTFHINYISSVEL